MILCCGEALIDMIPIPAENGKVAFAPYSGGAIFNTAVALGRLGIQVGMFTGMSNDLFGRQLTSSLHTSRVDTSMVVYCNAPTTLAFVELTDGHASYTFYDENTAGRILESRSIPPILDDVGSLYFGGISLCSEPAANTYLELAQREAADRVIIIDPNIRASFIENTTSFRARMDSFFKIADIIKVSDEDLNWLVPGTESLAEKVAILTAAGPSTVILTRGSEGATAFLKDGTEVAVPANRVEVVDTVGAGDTFNAGVLARLSELGFLSKETISKVGIAEMQNALQYGVNVAAVTVSRSGANPPWAHELV